MKLKNFQTKRALKKENERLRETIAMLRKDLDGNETEIVGLTNRACAGTSVDEIHYSLPHVMVV